MAVVCRAYTDETEARAAVDALMAAGVSGRAVKVLMGEATRDARQAAHGSFASSGGEESVGDFAGHEHQGASGMGTFAGSAEEQRGGSFADVDRETVTSYPEGVERRHVAGHKELRRLLIDAGLDEDVADRDVAALHEGRILVLADVGDRSPEEAAAAFGEG
jgi:hypothetical protein